jgi:hypothetical protein
VETAQRRKDVEQESERGIDAGRMSELGGRLEEVGKAATRNELGYDHDSADLTVDRSWPGETLVFEAAKAFDPVAQDWFERHELRAEHEPFEHHPLFAIECQDAPAESVGEARRRCRSRLRRQR